MKTYYLLIIFLLGLVTACGPKGESLEAKKARLSKLQKEADALHFEIQELQKQILSIDSNAIEKKQGKLVTTIKIEPDTFQHFIEIQGTAESDLNVPVSSELGGIVEKIYVEEGQHVKKGQLLIQLDDDIIQKEIDDIRVSLDLATTVYERQQKLWDKNIGSEIQLLQAKTNKESIEKKLIKAQTQLAKASVRAPVNGTVENIQVKEGEIARQGFPMLNVVNLNKINVKADAPEIYIGSFTKGESVKVSFPSISAEKDAKLSAVGNVVNPTNRTFRVEVEIPNKDNLLKANMLAVIKLMDYENKGVAVVPTNLIQYEGEKKFLYVIENKEGNSYAEIRYVQTGKSYAGRTEITSGLSPGDIVINAGSRDVISGDLVEISTDNKSI